MELLLKRRWLTEKSSIGELSIDGLFECFTLEDKTRDDAEPKVFGETAIPIGRYAVTIEPSPRFSKLAGHIVELPRLHEVPGFEGVLIHPGNVPDDTEGCILVGKERLPDEVLESRWAFGVLFPKLVAAKQRGEPIFITVEVEAAQGTEL